MHVASDKFKKMQKCTLTLMILPLIWLNYDNSPTWMLGHDSPILNFTALGLLALSPLSSCVFSSMAARAKNFGLVSSWFSQETWKKNTNFSIKIVLEYLTWSYDDSSKSFRSEARQIQIRDKNRWFSVETKTFYWFKPWSNKSSKHHWKCNSSISLSLSLAELSGSVLCLHFLGLSDSGE